jgi:hypothetical protein
MIVEAVNQGILNIVLNKLWEVPQFQFYMGDLANFMDYSNNFQADSPFTGVCSPLNGSHPLITVLDETTIYLDIN